MDITWIDESAEGEPVETQTETARRLGRSLDSVRNLVYRYPDRYPQPVARRGLQVMLRRVSEIDAFMEWVETRKSDRKPVEVAQSKLYRITESAERAKERVRRAEAALAAAKKHQFHVNKELRKAQDTLNNLQR